MTYSESYYVLNKLEDIRRYDEALFKHCVAVADLSFCIGSNLGLSPSACYDLWTAGALHDYGKLYVSRGILDKPSRLTPFEYSIMKCHVMMGFNVLAEGEQMNEVSLNAIAEHHERYRGDGYPVGDEKPDEFSQILAVADSFDALTAVRPYKFGLEKDDAIRIIKQQDVFKEDLINVLEKAVAAFSDSNDSLTFSER